MSAFNVYDVLFPDNKTSGAIQVGVPLHVFALSLGVYTKKSKYKLIKSNKQ